MDQQRNGDTSLAYLNAQIERLNSGKITESEFIHDAREKLGYSDDEARVVIRQVRPMPRRGQQRYR